VLERATTSWPRKRTGVGCSHSTNMTGRATGAMSFHV
jgi:hypothetical protein